MADLCDSSTAVDMARLDARLIFMFSSQKDISADDIVLRGRVLGTLTIHITNSIRSLSWIGRLDHMPLVRYRDVIPYLNDLLVSRWSLSCAPAA